MTNPLLGKCFKVSSSYGDGGEPWFVYRRVVDCGSVWCDCYRFEIRNSVEFGTEYAMRPRDPIAINVLKKQTEITQTEWVSAEQEFHRLVSEKWDTV